MPYSVGHFFFFEQKTTLTFVPNRRQSAISFWLLVTVNTLLGLTLFAVYWSGLHGGFFFDDTASILTPDGVRMASFSWSSLRDAFFSGTSGPSLRPVAQISFALNHLWGGFDPFLFKITNLAIHVVNTLLVFVFLSRLLQRGGSTDSFHGTFAAAIITALWALHPIQLLAILHAVQRMTSLSAGFILLGLTLHLQARDAVSTPRKTILFAVVWLVCWPLSILSKETGLLFPFFVLVCEFGFPRTSDNRTDTFTRWLTLTCVVLSLAAITYLISPAGRWILAGYDLRPFSLTERLMTEARVLWIYLDLLFVPRLGAFAIHHDDIPVSIGLLSPPSTAIALLAWSTTLFLTWHYRKKMPVIVFGISWFLVGHALESTFLPLEIAHEHRNYLPSLGILAATVLAASHLLTKLSVPKAVLGTITAVLITYCSFITGLRAHEFGNQLRLTQMEAENHPESPRAQSAAGAAIAALSQSKDPTSPLHTFARHHFEMSAKLSTFEKGSLLGLLKLDCAAGLAPSKQTIQELKKRLATPPFAPGDRNILFRIKEDTISRTLCLASSDVDALFASSLDNPSTTPGIQAIIYSWYADYLWLYQRDAVAAVESLENSLALAPHNSSNKLKLAQLFFLTGEHSKAKPLLMQLRTARLSQKEISTLNELLFALKLADN